MQKPADGRKRVVIESVEPQIDAGRYPIKRIIGDSVEVQADVFADGHDHVAARLLFRFDEISEWASVAMQPLGNDRWRAEFPVSRIGEYLYTVAGWIDHFDTWRSDLEKRIAAGQDIRVDLLNGALLVEQAAERSGRDDADELRRWATQLRGSDVETSQTSALDPALAAMMALYRDPAMETRYERELRVTVDREKARYSAWYEMFPRSTAAEPGRHGTFKDCEARLDYIARLGFDVSVPASDSSHRAELSQRQKQFDDGRTRGLRQPLGNWSERGRAHRDSSATRYAGGISPSSARRCGQGH